MRPPRGPLATAPRPGTALLGTLLVAGAVLLALVVAVRARDGSPFGWDSAVHGWVLGHRRRGLTGPARALTSSATAVPAYAAVALAGALGALGAAGGSPPDPTGPGRARPRRRARLLGALAAVLALAAGQLVRITLATWVGRERPPVTDWLTGASGPSFPSGHTTTAALVASVVCLALRRARPTVRWTGSAVSVAWAAGIGLTRVYLGVHWPSDVLAGWLLAGVLSAVLAAVLALVRRAGRGGPEASRRGRRGPCWAGDPVLRVADPGRSP